MSVGDQHNKELADIKQTVHQYSNGSYSWHIDSQQRTIKIKCHHFNCYSMTHHRENCQGLIFVL